MLQELLQDYPVYPDMYLFLWLGWPQVTVEAIHEESLGVLYEPKALIAALQMAVSTHLPFNCKLVPDKSDNSLTTSNQIP
jgi:hypothetical protein